MKKSELSAVHGELSEMAREMGPEGKSRPAVLAVYTDGSGFFGTLDSTGTRFTNHNKFSDIVSLHHILEDNEGVEWGEE